MDTLMILIKLNYEFVLIFSYRDTFIFLKQAELCICCL